MKSLKNLSKAYFNKMNKVGNSSYPFNHLNQLKETKRKPVIEAPKKSLNFSSLYCDKAICSYIAVLFVLAVLVYVK